MEINRDRYEVDKEEAPSKEAFEKRMAAYAGYMQKNADRIYRNKAGEAKDE